VTVPRLSLPRPARTSRQVSVVFVGLCIGMMLSAIDATIVATALPSIVRDLDGESHLSWVATAYLLFLMASTPLYGKLGDLYGRKRIFQAAILIFLAGSVLAGLSRDMGQLIACRAVQGLGAGGLSSLAMAITADIVPARDRGRFLGYQGMLFSVASIGGPFVGGVVVDHLSWRWVFYVNVPVGLAALAIVSGNLHVAYRRVAHAVDYAGAALLVGCVTSLVLVTSLGGDEVAWGSPLIVALGALVPALLAAFIARERRAPEPVLPLPLLRNPILAVAAIVNGLGALLFFTGVYFLPVFFQQVKGVSPTRSGVLLIPFMLGTVAGTIGSGRAVTRTGRYKPFPVAGGAVMAAGVLLLASAGTQTSIATVGVYAAILGIGIGLVLQVLLLAAQNAVPPRDLGTATSTVIFARALSGAVGLAVFGTILSNRLDFHRPRMGEAAAYAHSLQVVFLAALPVALAALVVTLFLREIPLQDVAHVGPAATPVAP
jgi:EmrB/QacA subfamily drug resistance transporter